MENEWNDAIVKNDLGWYEKNFATEFRFVDESGEVRTKAQQIEKSRTDKTRVHSAELSNMNVRVDGNTAVVDHAIHGRRGGRTRR